MSDSGMKKVTISRVVRLEKGACKSSKEMSRFQIGLLLLIGVFSSLEES